MLTKRSVSIVACAAIFVLVSGSVLAQIPDFESTISGSVDTATADSTVSYQVDVANLGDGESSGVIILDIYLPSGVPCDINAYLNGNPDANAAFDAFWDTVQYSDGVFDPDDPETGIYFGPDVHCENFILQPQGLILPGNSAGSWFFDAVMPTPPFYDGAVHVSSATQDTDFNFGEGECESTIDCSQHPCLGPRISTIEPITATLELVDDGSAQPTLGCNALQNFSTGNIALIDRGSCDFEVKIANALFAGASAVLVADNDDFTDLTVDPHDVIDMGCTSYCSEELVTIPAAFVSFADAQLLHADLDAHNLVTATVGKMNIGNTLTTKSYIWESQTTPLDTNDDNNHSSVTTLVTGDGPTGPTADFSYVTDDLMASFTNTSTGGASSWVWDFGDGTGSSTEQNPVYTYADAGSYDVTLTAMNASGTDKITKTVSVTAPAVPPVANFSYVADDLTVTFSDTSTGDPSSWMWDFGDGTGSSTEQSPVHVYAVPGYYDVTLTATNSIESNNITKIVLGGAPGRTVPLFADGFESGTSCWWNWSMAAASCAPDFSAITITLPGDVSMDLVRIPAGTFMMGSPEDETGHRLNEDLHKVTLTHDYYIGKYEVTRAQWNAVMGSGGGDNTPVDWVDWDDICGGPTSSSCISSSFIGKLNAYLTQTGQPGAGEFRLPTEAEWERAARGGTQTAFSFGDYGSCVIDDCSFCDIFDNYMVYCENDNADVVEVGSRAPNSFGLYDMHGNVYEWVGDWYTDHLGSNAVHDPVGPKTGSSRPLRGGSHWRTPSGCRSASRMPWPGLVSPAYGFRLARSE